jgi:hypothetical protein
LMQCSKPFCPGTGNSGIELAQRGTPLEGVGRGAGGTGISSPARLGWSMRWALCCRSTASTSVPVPPAAGGGRRGRRWGWDMQRGSVSHDDDMRGRSAATSATAAGVTAPSQVVASGIGAGSRASAGGAQK